MKNEMISLNELTSYQSLLKKGTVLLDITASGRYWRTSMLEVIRLIYRGETALTEQILSLEEEQDEPTMLTLLEEKLRNFEEVITFNGNSFDIPHLKRKYAAYGMVDPFPGKQFRDLYLEYKDYAVLLGLPSRKLADYAAFAAGDTASDDAVKTLKTLSLDSISAFFSGSWTLEDAKRDGDHLYYTLRTDRAFFHRISFQDQIFHLILDRQTAKLSVLLVDGKVRRYYTNYKDYYYLPLEGYSIHKSMAAYVQKTHKEKAVRQNCFNLVSYSEAFVNDPDRIRSYISSVLQFLQSR
jgi:hypothetical protein